jgi:hypothetical protein
MALDHELCRVPLKVGTTSCHEFGGMGVLTLKKTKMAHFSARPSPNFRGSPPTHRSGADGEQGRVLTP